ncbi:MAG: LOG family protein [Myxococcota bacterium]
MKPTKAYKNLEYINSPEARTIRMMCEYEEPRRRFRRYGVKDTIVFFGSARAKPQEESRLLVKDAERKVSRSSSSEERRRLEHQVKQAKRVERMARYYEDACELSRRLTAWDMQRDSGRHYYVATGGGPGIMEAANRGASLVEGGKSIGLGISLPFEESLNPWVSPELAFEFHYFFTRKYWFLYLAKAMIIFPGGFGTMDELFETMTLRQTGKIKKPLPTVLFGTEYWNEVFNIQAMVDWGTISEKDLLLYHLTDSIDDAYDYIVGALEANEALRRARPRPPKPDYRPVGSLMVPGEASDGDPAPQNGADPDEHTGVEHTSVEHTSVEHAEKDKTS